MYGASTNVDVTEIDPKQAHLDRMGPLCRANTGRMGVCHASRQHDQGHDQELGFRGEHVVSQAIDATQGFSFMLAALKAWLEDHIRLGSAQR
jgi:hypothetical protein